MSLKSKGINAERELIRLFWETGEWLACRVAGSGSSRYPAPDIIAGNNNRIVAIECKTGKGNIKYIPREVIFQLKGFAKIFGAEPWIAIKFGKNGWYFLSSEKMESTEKGRKISEGQAKERGVNFKDFVSLHKIDGRMKTAEREDNQDQQMENS